MNSQPSRELAIGLLAEDAAREVDNARRTFKDSTQSGDHTPQLVHQFDTFAWHDPAGARVKQWLGATTRR